MRKYDNYKDSGIEWIGEIPEHWEVKKIKHSIDLIMGQSPSSDDCNSLGNGIPFLQGNADFGSINPLPQSWCVKPTKIAPLNSILLSVRAPIGAVNIADNDYCIGRGLCALISETPKFLYYNSICLHNELNSLGTGSTFKAISTEQILNTYTVLPTPEEQTAIANYLDRKTTEIDELIADKKRLLELYEEEKTAIINELVTGKKVWNGNAWTEPAEVKDSGIEWLGEIPEHWEVKKVKHVLKSLNSIRVPLSADERGKMVVRKYDYYGASGVIDKVEDYLFDEPLLLIGEDGANLVTRSTRLSFIAKGKYWVNNHAHILKPTYGLLEYYCELMELCDYSIWISGSAQPKLTSENLMNIQVIVPPIEEQQSIVHHIETECALIDAKKEKTKKLIDLLTEYRTALISEVVTGKIKVTE